MGAKDTSIGEGGRSFPATSWSIVAGIQDSDDTTRGRALDSLCQRYWKPVYHYIRRAWSKSSEDAKDLTQGFFFWLLDGDALKRYEAGRGGFRTYLKVLLRGFSADEHDKIKALKRGGGVRWLRMDHEDSPLREVVPDSRAEKPEEALDRSWIREVLDRSLERLRQSYVAEGSEKQFLALEEYVLVDDQEKRTYADVGRKLGMSESEIRNHLHAARIRLKAEIRAEVSQTVKSQEDLEVELKELFGF